jgi:hypothetical protein
VLGGLAFDSRERIPRFGFCRNAWEDLQPIWNEHKQPLRAQKRRPTLSGAHADPSNEEASSVWPNKAKWALTGWIGSLLLSRLKRNGRFVQQHPFD